jgi:hypothetical protein
MDAQNQPPPIEDLLPIDIGRRNRPDLTAIVKSRIVSFYLERCSDVNGVQMPARGTSVTAANFFGIDRTSAAKIWKTASDNKNNPDIGFYTASPKRKGRCGRKPLYDLEVLEAAVAEMPRENRKNIRSVAANLGVSTWTVQKMMKENHIRRVSSPLNAYLTENNKWMRLEYAVGQISRMENGMFSDNFRDSYDEIHIDEKWFNITELTTTYYLASDETPPTRRVINKGHITKVMFLVAVARPRFDDDGGLLFDGKIGCWPITEQTPALRNSINRLAGTMVTRTVNVTAIAYKLLFFDKLLPAIREKWPCGNIQEVKHIRLQHDNAPVHFKKTDNEWIQAAQQYADRFNFTLKEQPANSPDTNILDLGFFESLQTLQQQQRPADNIDELVQNVLTSWQQFDPIVLNRTFITHQSVCDVIIQSYGDNDYNTPHLAKEAQERQGTLPITLPVSQQSKNVILELAIPP